MSQASSAPHVVIVGGGGTGGAVAHDLILRGLRVTLVERGEITSGTTGRHHGLLHSGARYAVKDRESAVECIEENQLLRRIAPGFVRVERRLVRRRSPRRTGVRPEALRRVPGVRDIPARLVTRERGAPPRAQPQPRGPQGRDPGPGRDDGRDADAAALVRHGQAQRGLDPAVHRGGGDERGPDSRGAASPASRSQDHAQRPATTRSVRIWS